MRAKTAAILMLITGVLTLSAALLAQVDGAGKKDITGPRIVSHLPSLTEISYALGLGENIVGVTDFCKYPPEAAQKQSIGGILNPNYEIVLSLKPDLLLLQENQKEIAAKYELLNLKTLVLKGDTISSTISSINKIGKATGKEAQAWELTDRIKADFQTLKAKQGDRRKIKTLVVIGHEPGALKQIFCASRRSFIGELVQVAGGENVIDGSVSAFPLVSKEEIVTKSPEVIIVLCGTEQKDGHNEQAERKLWESLGTVDAVRTQRIYLISGDLLLIPGPRMIQAAKVIRGLLYPENTDKKIINEPAKEDE